MKKGVLAVLAALGCGLCFATSFSTRAVDKPKVPLSSSSRWIVDSEGQRVKLRCINWAGHLEANVPEGLHRQSVERTADWIAAQGFNCVRLTYSIDMARNPGIRVEDSFRSAARAAGVDEAALMALYAAAVDRNPFLAQASVLDAFDHVQAALWDRGVMTVLDNHVSCAGWCCDLLDGNGWWKDAGLYVAANSRFFDTAHWRAGLAAMAAWSASRPGIVGLSLRNELRASFGRRCRHAVHDANPRALVIVGGINGGVDLTPLRSRCMDTGPWAHKRVWEAHSYSFTPMTPNFGICPLLRAEYGGLFGFVLEQHRPCTGPLFLSEFGVGMIGGPRDGLSLRDDDFLACLVGYMEDNDADWALWALQGSYYVRDKVVDHNETWGALDHDWNDWRNPNFKSRLGKMLNVTQGPWE